MRVKDIRSVIDIIISSTWYGKERIDDLIIKIVYNSPSLQIDRDLLLDELADSSTNAFEKLVKIVQSTIEENKNFNKIQLFKEVDGIYIQKQHKNIKVDTKYDEVIQVINDFENEKNKGIIYEKFCQAFLEDLGIKCSSTKASGDKGIDIQGSYLVNFKDDIANLVFNEEIYLLVQSKYFAGPIDTPVIRKLVGDSLFIRFDELEYLTIRHNAVHLIVFSHNGFTQPAKDFAKKNKVKIFDSRHVAHIISEKPDKRWKCLLIV